MTHLTAKLVLPGSVSTILFHIVLKIYFSERQSHRRQEDQEIVHLLIPYLEGHNSKAGAGWARSLELSLPTWAAEAQELRPPFTVFPFILMQLNSK